MGKHFILSISEFEMAIVFFDLLNLKLLKNIYLALNIGIIRSDFISIFVSYFFAKIILSEIIIMNKYIFLQFRALVFLYKNFVLWIKTASTAHAQCTLKLIPWNYGAGNSRFSLSSA